MGDPKVSILIPNKDHIDDLEHCLHSLYQNAGYDNFEVIVIENNSTDPATFAYYRDSPAALLRRPAGGHYTQRRVQLLGHQQLWPQVRQGEYLLLLNNDVEVRNARLAH